MVGHQNPTTSRGCHRIPAGQNLAKLADVRWALARFRPNLIGLQPDLAKQIGFRLDLAGM